MKWSSIRWFLCVFTLVILFSSCENNETNEVINRNPSRSNIGSTEFTIEAAKKWFEEEYLIAQKVTESEKSKNLVRNVYWDLAFKDKMSNGQDLLIVPVEHHDRNRLPNADTYLWIFTNENEFSGKVVEYLSYEAGGVEKLDLHNFSGGLSVRDWNGNLLNGFTFKRGVPVGVLQRVNDEETLIVKNKKSLKTAGTTCENVQITVSSCNTYYYKVCVPHLGYCTEWNTSGTFCELTSFNVLQCYWIADFPGQTNPYVGGSNNGVTATSVESLSIPGFDKSAISVQKFINCFGTNTSSSTYKMTIYVAEPNPGSGKAVWGTDVGHTFVGLEKNTNGFITRQVVGFYPDAKSTSWVSSHMADNGGSSYTVSTTYDLNAAGFQSALNALAYQQSQMYHIASYNCTTAAAYVCDAVGVTFPKNETYFPFFSTPGLSPGKLGQDLRNNQSTGTLNTNGGLAPTSKGPCN